MNRIKCLTCELTKRNKLAHNNNSNIHINIPGECLSVDYKGPINPTAIGGYTGFIIYVCCATGFIKLYLVKSKSEFLSTLQKIIELFGQYGHKVNKLRNDSGTVEMDEKVKSFCRTNQIIQEPALPESQYQNPVERYIQTSVNSIRSNNVRPKCNGPSMLGSCRIILGTNT